MCAGNKQLAQVKYREIERIQVYASKKQTAKMQNIWSDYCFGSMVYRAMELAREKQSSIPGLTYRNKLRHYMVKSWPNGCRFIRRDAIKVKVVGMLVTGEPNAARDQMKEMIEDLAER